MTRAVHGTTATERAESVTAQAGREPRALTSRMKILKPLPHAVLDYAWGGAMIAAPWLLGFKKNKTATINSVAAGAGIIGLSLMTRYPLGVAKLIPFPTHGVIETIAGGLTALDPWLLGYAKNKRARWTHVAAGLSTLAVVALTDYRAQG
jgi:hypothetical protein